MMYGIVKLDGESKMSGMLPTRKSREEVEQANRELIKQHQQYVSTWAKDRQSENEIEFTEPAGRVHLNVLK